MRKWYSLPTQRILETAPWPKFPSYCFLTHFRPTPPAEILFLLFRNHRPPLFVEAPLSAHRPRLVSGAFVYQYTRLCSQPHRTGVTSPSRHALHFLLRRRYFAIAPYVAFFAALSLFRHPSPSQSSPLTIVTVALSMSKYTVPGLAMSTANIAHTGSTWGYIVIFCC